MELTILQLKTMFATGFLQLPLITLSRYFGHLKFLKQIQSWIDAEFYCVTFCTYRHAIHFPMWIYLPRISLVYFLHVSGLLDCIVLSFGENTRLGMMQFLSPVVVLSITCLRCLHLYSWMRMGCEFHWSTHNRCCLN